MSGEGFRLTRFNVCHHCKASDGTDNCLVITNHPWQLSPCKTAPHGKSFEEFVRASSPGTHASPCSGLHLHAQLHPPAGQHNQGLKPDHESLYFRLIATKPLRHCCKYRKVGKATYQLQAPWPQQRLLQETRCSNAALSSELEAPPPDIYSQQESHPTLMTGRVSFDQGL